MIVVRLGEEIMGADTCLFCRMVDGTIPVARVYEDEVVLAFLDIGPVSDGHTLVIPKKHYEKLDSCPEDVLSQLAARLGRIVSAISGALNCDGYNVLCNNGRAAGQVVEHLHFHVIPRGLGDGVFTQWPSFKYPAGKAERIAAAIRNYL